jgi:hypothetical protein
MAGKKNEDLEEAKKLLGRSLKTLGKAVSKGASGARDELGEVTKKVSARLRAEDDDNHDTDADSGVVESGLDDVHSSTERTPEDDNAGQDGDSAKNLLNKSLKKLGAAANKGVQSAKHGLNELTNNTDSGNSGKISDEGQSDNHKNSMPAEVAHKETDDLPSVEDEGSGSGSNGGKSFWLGILALLAIVALAGLFLLNQGSSSSNTSEKRADASSAKIAKSKSTASQSESIAESSEEAASSASESSAEASSMSEDEAEEKSHPTYLDKFKDYSMYYVFDIKTKHVTVIETDTGEHNTYKYTGDFNHGVKWTGGMSASYHYVDHPDTLLVTDASGDTTQAYLDSYDSAKEYLK